MFSFKIIPLLIVILLNDIQCSEDSVSVRLKSGVINGKIETSFNNKKVNVFKGIPFAEPPIGSLRFRRPQPVKTLAEDF